MTKLMLGALLCGNDDEEIIEAPQVEEATEDEFDPFDGIIFADDVGEDEAPSSPWAPPVEVDEEELVVVR